MDEAICLNVNGFNFHARPVGTKRMIMFGKVKRWLGIEGVKVEMILPEQVLGKSGIVDGQIMFTSMHDQTVKKIRIVLTEKFIRGRWKKRLTDMYKIGEIDLIQDIFIPAHEPMVIDFELPFTLIKSDMDEIGDKNFVLRKMVNAAKALKNVHSEFYIEAEAEVEGTALHPFDKQQINIIL